MTPLMVAASEGQTAIARMLSGAEAIADAKEQDGTTALMRAASAIARRRAATAKSRRECQTSGGMTALIRVERRLRDPVRTLSRARRIPSEKTIRVARR
jgi:hypothetical protein